MSHVHKMRIYSRNRGILTTKCFECGHTKTMTYIDVKIVTRKK